jgi:hypothetical protein
MMIYDDDDHVHEYDAHPDFDLSDHDYHYDYVNHKVDDRDHVDDLLEEYGSLLELNENDHDHDRDCHVDDDHLQKYDETHMMSHDDDHVHVQR